MTTPATEPRAMPPQGKGRTPPPPGGPAGPGRGDALPKAPLPLALGAVASGLLAALILPDQQPGLGLFLVAMAVTASVAAVRPRRITPDIAGLAAIGLGLSAVTLLRSAPWLLGVDVVAALGLACVVVAGGSTWAQVLGAPVAVLGAVPRAPGFLWRGLLRRRGAPRPSSLLRGAALGAVLLLVFGGLFVSADRAFAHLASALVPDWDVGLLPFRVVVFALVAVTVGTYAAAAPRFTPLWASPGTSAGLWRGALGDERRAPRRLGRTEWVVALSLLDLLFVAFVVLQITVLFGGHARVLETAGLTYAEYARQGFFQLLAVGALTLGVVAAAVRWGSRPGRRDALVLRALLGILCALTLVVLASALRRLGLYEEAFGFTRARLAAHAIILWLGGLLILVMVAGIRMRAWWLPKVAVAFTGAALLVFSLVDPDAIVAATNVERYRDTGRMDIGYLAALSPDAVPALAGLPPRLRACVLFLPGGIADGLAEQEPWYAWNLGRARARSVISSLGTPDRRVLRCPAGASP